MQQPLLKLLGDTSTSFFFCAGKCWKLYSELICVSDRFCYGNSFIPDSISGFFNIATTRTAGCRAHCMC